MDKVLDFISRFGVLMIVVFAIAILVWLIVLMTRLSSHKSLIVAALDNRKNLVASINKNTLEVSESVDHEDTVTPDTIRAYEKRFNEICSSYEVCSQLITLFPLMGILGTVAGLMLQLDKSGADIALIKAGLDVALSTTFAGLVAAIILKAIAVLGPSRIIFDTDIMISDYNKKVDNALRLKNITEE